MLDIVKVDRNRSLVLKGIAILMVMLGHTNYILWGGAGGVDLFLILSGYGLNCSVREKGLQQYWQKRMRSVWVPYCFVGLIQILAGNTKGTLSVVCTFLGLDFCLIMDRTMWFISFILLWYAVYYVLEYVTRKISRDTLRVIILIAGLLVAAFLIRRLFYNTSVWNYPSGAARYVLAFPLGVAFGEMSRVQVKTDMKTAVWGALLLVLLAWLLRCYSESYDTSMGFAMALFPIAVSQLIQVDAKFLNPIKWIGRYSYSIYLFEGIFLTYRQQWFGTFGSQLMIDLAWMITTCIVAYIYWEGVYCIFLRILDNMKAEGKKE